jgi:hypothetical protein
MFLPRRRQFNALGLSAFALPASLFATATTPAHAAGVG